MRKIEIPTGYLFVDGYSRGELETLSIGDYGKAHNVKADFLGLTRRIEGVPNVPCMPLQEKWVVTLSTQYGCPMRCTFCDVPRIKFNGNATFDDLRRQLVSALDLFPDVAYTERLNVHFARMGDPIFNAAVLEFARWMYENKRALRMRVEVIHPVLTTSCPRKMRSFEDRLHQWCSIKNDTFNGQAGLQLSINSTNDAQREEMFSGMSLRLDDLARISRDLPDPVGRKYCLNFAYATGYEIDAARLSDLFDQRRFMAKITPIHNNNACRASGIATVDGYDSWAPYAKPEDDLRRAGWDVLVFVPSFDEEDGLVTCGNAVLSGSDAKSGPVKIEGIA